MDMDDVAAFEGGRRRVVVVAVDEGEESICALRWSLRCICAAERDALVLLYVRPPSPVFSALDASENRRDHHLFGTEIDFTPNLQEPETGYVFSEEVTASIDKYSRDLADSVMEKAKNICKAYENEEKFRSYLGVVSPINPHEGRKYALGQCLARFRINFFHLQFLKFLIVIKDKGRGEGRGGGRERCDM